MVQTFPMALDEFFEGLPIQSFKSDLGEAMEYNQDGSGAILTADMGPRLWKNDIIVRTGNYTTIEQIKARLNLLRYPGRSLFVHAMPFMAPQYDPDGSILGANQIKLADVDSSNNRSIDLSGFPPNYELRIGDFLSFSYGSNPIRYAMHQVANNNIATGDPYDVNIRNLGAPFQTGTSTAATYNTSTGVGTIARVNSSNQSSVQWTGLTIGATYRMVISNTGTQVIQLRATPSGTIYDSIEAGQTRTIDFVPLSQFVYITCGVTTGAFTVTSLRKYLGVTMTDIEVMNFIRPGYVLGSSVTLIKPFYKAVVVPGSTDVGSMGSQFGDGVKFSVVQTLGR